jgi:hypothetical protein
MPYSVLQSPGTIYPGEVHAECPEAEPVVDALLLEFKRQGPQPAGYSVKNLGKRLGGLWQINLKVAQRQIRILYAPYKDRIVLFRIHKKGSPQEQKRAYEVAQKRKAAFEESERRRRDGNRTIH